MSNKSAEYPEGYLNQDVLKSFFAITGESGSFTWNEGYEAIPDNWYKRAIGDEYTIPGFLVDLLDAAVQYPQFLSIGGNTGTVNSFSGVDITNLTNGLFNSASLLDADNLGCFIKQNAMAAIPDILEGILSPDSSILGQVAGVLDDLLDTILPGVTCPTLSAINVDQYSDYPGYTKQEQYSR